VSLFYPPTPSARFNAWRHDTFHELRRRKRRYFYYQATTHIGTQRFHRARNRENEQTKCFAHCCHHS
jgi:hypothetical protein